MPHKHNNSRRHKFKKAKYRVTNWSEYNDALRKRGDITVWFTDEEIDAWVPDRVPGQKGRPVEYSELAIECSLMIRQVFRLPLRQTEGFLTSLVRLMDLDIAIPDYSCLSKRSIDLRLERLAATVTAGSHILRRQGRGRRHEETVLLLRPVASLYYDWNELRAVGSGR